ncbi:MAG TPA: hypothetical protein VE175_16080, partial [Woeseiaceae bacterium]|nr:hypothetical protein [Woeseiaceae bacterium]
PDLPDATLSARAKAGGTLSNLELQAKVGAIHQGQRLAAELHTALEGDELRVQSLSLALPEHQARLDASGRLRLTGNFPVDASLAWQNLKWPLRADPDYRSAGGRATLTGSLDDYKLSTNAQLTLPGDVPLRASVSGEGDREHLDAGMRVDVLEGWIDGTAAVSWRPSFEANIDLEGNEVDPSAFSPDWPGQLDFVLRAQAAAGAQEPALVRLETLVVNGQLRGEPLSIESEGAYEAGDLTVDRLQAELGATRVMARGRYSDTADLEWQIESDDLGQLLPSATGAVTSTGTLSGAPPRLVVDATLNASRLGYRNNRIESLTLSADVDLTDRQPSNVDLHIEGIDSPALTGNAVHLAVEGRLSDHRASVTADTSRGSTDLQVEGRWRDPWSANTAWLYKITQATVAYPELRPWELDSPAEGTLTGAAISVRHHCWKSGRARVCLAGERIPKRTHGQFSLDQLDFGYFAGFLPATVELEGKLSGRGEIVQAAGGRLRADVALQTGSGRLALHGVAEAGNGGSMPAQTVLDVEPSRLSLTLDENAASASARLNFGQGRIDLQGHLSPPAAPPMRRQLGGRLQVDVPDIAFIAPFVPDIENLRGKLNGELEFSGTQAHPRVAGRIALAEGALMLPAAGIRLEGLRAALEGRDDAGVRLDASARSGGGNLQLTGELELGETPASASMEVAGEDFQLLGNKEARVFVTPDLNVDASA